MRPSETQVCLSFRWSICPSVGLYICPLCLRKIRVFRLFLATVRSCTESNERETCFECLFYYSVISSVCPFICLSIYATSLAPNLIHAETHFGRIIARSGL